MESKIDLMIDYVKARVVVYENMLLGGMGGYAVKEELKDILRMLEDVKKGR